MHNLYPLRYQEAVHAATAAARGEGERIAWSRSGWAGSQRFPVHWGGDVPPAWEMLAPQLHGGLSLRRDVLIVLILSGGLAGLGGMVEVSGVIHRLTDRFSPGYGFTAIAVGLVVRLVAEPLLVRLGRGGPGGGGGDAPGRLPHGRRPPGH